MAIPSGGPGLVLWVIWIALWVTVVAILVGGGVLLFAPILARNPEDVYGLKAWGRRLIGASLRALVVLLLAAVVTAGLATQP